MQYTVGKHDGLFERQKFRITFKGKDFEIVLLKKDISKETTEIRLLLDGIVQHLVLREGKWCFDHGED
ncbi:hypothetical protein [Chryseobacterium sp. 2987]|uniref:hypothetical protein n=1 Tax=Chryseobacterium sp. 2987 TaxID=2817767 RepID=UPI0028597FE3|nr:hypothetical protein [Chryseobacterium sp. 2987]MDR6919527.1 hypothetical protein [Chryseobacterium sp. 2987]